MRGPNCFPVAKSVPILSRFVLHSRGADAAALGAVCKLFTTTAETTACCARPGLTMRPAFASACFLRAARTAEPEPATPHGVTLQHAGKTAHRRRAKTRARVRACVFPASGRRATTLLSSSAEPRPKIVCAEKRFRQMKTAPPRTKPARDTFEAPRNAFVPALGGESPGEGRWGGRKDSRARRIRPPIPSRARLSLQPLCARDRR